MNPSTDQHSSPRSLQAAPLAISNPSNQTAYTPPSTSIVGITTQLITNVISSSTPDDSTDIHSSSFSGQDNTELSYWGNSSNFNDTDMSYHSNSVQCYVRNTVKRKSVEESHEVMEHALPEPPATQVQTDVINIEPLDGSFIQSPHKGSTGQDFSDDVIPPKRRRLSHEVIYITCTLMP